LIAKKDSSRRKKGKMIDKEGVLESGPITVRSCERCGKSGHNVRTCLEDKELLDKDSLIESN
jgi:hypothetical protein